MRVENGVVQINYNYTGCESTVGSVSKARCPTVPSTASSLQYPIVPFPVTGPPLSGALIPTGGTAPAVNGPADRRPAELPRPRSQLRSALAHEFELRRRAVPARQACPSRSAMWAPAACVCPSSSTPTSSARPRTARAATTSQDANNNVIKQITVPVYLPSDRRNSAITVASTPASAWPTPGTTRSPSPSAVPSTTVWNCWLTTPGPTPPTPARLQGNIGTFYGGDTPLDPNNVRLENGPSDIDIRNRFASASSTSRSSC